MTASANVVHAQGDTTKLMLILSLDTNCAVYSISLTKLPGANLSRVRNLTLYSSMVMPSIYCKDKNSFFWLWMVAKKYWT